MKKKNVNSSLYDFLSAYLDECYPPFKSMSENSRMYFLIMLGSLVLKFLAIACQGSENLK